jgi:hypothetical protein
MFKIKAKFIGVNSLGFINGRIYEMHLISMPHIGKGMIEIATENHKPKLRCEYGSWEKFILNWEILHYQNMTGSHEAEVHHTKVNNGLKSSARDTKIKKVLS